VKTGQGKDGKDENAKKGRKNINSSIFARLFVFFIFAPIFSCISSLPSFPPGDLHAE
jgi:hypothetical protein